jgi:hypothetical protein
VRSYSWFITCHRGCIWGRNSCFYLLSDLVRAAWAGIEMCVFDRWLMSWHNCGHPELWLNDISRKHNFVMRTTLMWTINYFPAHGMVSGWSTYGKLACPYCMIKKKLK